MNELAIQFVEAIESDSLIQLVLSQPIRSGTSTSSEQGGSVSDFVEKVVVRPVDLKSGRNFQFTFCEDRQETHRNLVPEEAVKEVDSLISGQFRKGHLFTQNFDFTVKVKASGKVRASLPTVETEDRFN